MFRARLRMMVLALRQSGSRAALAVSTVALAIASMMLMLALSAGASRQLDAINGQLGRNLLGVSAVDIAAPPGRPQPWVTSPRLKLEDVATLRGDVDGVGAVVPVREGTFVASLARLSTTTTVVGTTPAYLALRNLHVREGRALDERDGRVWSRVAVVGSYVARRLNGGFSMVGETIWIGRVPFEVVGQFEEKGVSSDGRNEDDQVVIPLETAMRRLFNTDSLSRLMIQVVSEERAASVQSSARELLRAGHQLDDEVKDDFRILSLVRVNEIRRRSSEFIQALAAVFAVVTLAIGGVGVLAVTVLNVKERVPEIGLRIAVGARPRDITRLFIAEACLLSATGGIAGLLAGWIGIAVLDRLLDWALAVDIRGVAVPLGVSLLVGLVFSLVPAVRASAVMPVEALRDR